jgi:hypothetical protein
MTELSAAFRVLSASSMSAASQAGHALPKLILAASAEPVSPASILCQPFQEGGGMAAARFWESDITFAVGTS